MSKQTKTILIAAVVLLALIVGLFAIRGAFAPDAETGAKTVTLQIVHADGSEKTVTMHTDAENLLGALLEQEGLIEGEGEGSSFFVTTVDGETADWNENQAYWAFTRDGEWLETGAHDTLIRDGDHFEFTYTVGAW